MRAYKRLTTYSILFFTAWFSLSIIVKVFDIPQNTLFPYYSWILFHEVSKKYKDVDLEIYEVDGKLLDKPLSYIRDIRPNQDPFSFSIPKRILKRLYDSTVKSEYSSTAEIKKSFERRFMRGFRSCKYKLLLLYYNPYERYKNPDKPIEETKVVAEYSCGE